VSPTGTPEQRRKRGKGIAWVGGVTAAAALLTAVGTVFGPIHLFGGDGAAAATPTVVITNKGSGVNDAGMTSITFKRRGVWSFKGTVASLKPGSSIRVIGQEKGSNRPWESADAVLSGTSWTAEAKAPTSFGEAIVWSAQVFAPGTLPLTDPREKWTAVVRRSH